MDIRMDSLHVSGHSLQHIGVVRLVYEMEPKLKGAIHLGIEGKYKLQIEFQVFLASRNFKPVSNPKNTFILIIHQLFSLSAGPAA